MAYDYKQDFPLLRAMDVAYVDNAATAQRPQCVLDAENDFYCRHNANPLRGLYPLSVEATDAYENAREAVRDFLGAASTQEIIFTRNTTESLNLVAYSYGLSHIKTGDEVVVSIMEHHSNLLPWQMVCRRTGALTSIRSSSLSPSARSSSPSRRSRTCWGGSTRCARSRPWRTKRARSSSSTARRARPTSP